MDLPRRRLGPGTSAARRSTAESFPRDRFSKVFFQPLYAGQTFGLGQINPLTALTVVDIVQAATLSLDKRQLYRRSWISISAISQRRIGSDVSAHRERVCRQAFH